MADNENSYDNMEIEALSDEDLEQVAGGNASDSDLTELENSSSGPECCSCKCCSPNNC
jgi:hypothetical protein